MPPLRVIRAAMLLQQELYATAALDAKTNEVIIKLVNTSATNKALELNIKGLAKTALGNSIILTDKDLKNFNTIDKPNKFIPIESTLSVSKGKTLVNLDGYTFQIIRIKK